MPRVSYFKHSGCIPSVDETLGLISAIKKEAPYLQGSVKKGNYCSECSCNCAFFSHIGEVTPSNIFRRECHYVPDCFSFP